MLDASAFREIVSGRRRGLGAAAVRGMLRLVEIPYTLTVNWRNRRFDRLHRSHLDVGSLVISVGNLTLGGTGKTPLVKWLGRWFVDRGVRVAIVSRGYGARPGQQNDEARELAQALPEVPHVQNPDRIAATRQVVEQFGSQVILLDDAFQHRRMSRHLDVVLLDSLEPFGFEHVFPRGMLREPIGGLRRAHVVCLSRADLVSPAARTAIRTRAMSIANNAVWCELAHVPTGLISADGKRHPLEGLAGKRVAAFCGIGNPAAFRHTLAVTGCKLVAWHEFPDHHSYGADDASAMDRLAAQENAELVVCTEKDVVKWNQTEIGGRPLLAVAVGIQLLSGGDELTRVLEKALHLSGIQMQTAKSVSPSASRTDM